MKYNNYFLIFICMISLFVFSSCEHAELQRSTSSTTEKINTRTNDCGDCPIDHCCCAIQYQSGNGGLMIEFCGSTGTRLSDEECELASPPSPCSAIEGYYLGPYQLDINNQRHVFCMEKNSSLLINVTGSGFVNVSITCQLGETAPQTINITLTAGNRYFFNADGSCEIEECS